MKRPPAKAALRPVTKTQRQRDPGGAANDAANLDSCLTKVLSCNIESPVPFLQLSGSKAPVAAHTTLTFMPGSNPTLLRDPVCRYNFPDFVCLQEVPARYSDKHGLLISPRAQTPRYTCLDLLQRPAAAGAAWTPTSRRIVGLGSGPQYTMYHHSLNRSNRGQRHFGAARVVVRGVA